MSGRNRQTRGSQGYRTHRDGYFHLRASYAHCESVMFTPTQHHMIAYIDRILDKLMAPLCGDSELALDMARIYKVHEERGETAEAFVGWRGLNPRKGVTHTREQVLEELADWALTPIYAMTHLTKDTQEVERALISAMLKHYRRATETEL